MNKYEQFKSYTRCPLETDFSGVTDNALEHYLLERYIDNSLDKQSSSLSLKALIRATYYKLRPLFPVAFRKHLQKMALRGWQDIEFPAWPIDTTVDDQIAQAFRHMLSSGEHQRIPFIWFWPHGHRYAVIMTHDVETAAGRDFTAKMMKMESNHGIVSAFEVVPEVRYEVDEAYLESIRNGGCEVCLHGLNHDGHLFDSPEEFQRRIQKLKDYAADFDAVGFRSPIMYRNLDWLSQLPFAYDMSVPNNANIDPQRGGCCTVMPYFVGNVLELPLTTIQDYSLFNIINDYTLDLWHQQASVVRSRFGLLSFIVHPDYTIADNASKLYNGLLSWLAELRKNDNAWLVLPREINTWWRRRSEMEIIRRDGRWVISGAHSEDATLAFASLHNGQLQFELENGPSWVLPHSSGIEPPSSNPLIRETE